MTASPDGSRQARRRADIGIRGWASSWLAWFGQQAATAIVLLPWRRLSKTKGSNRASVLSKRVALLVAAAVSLLSWAGVAQAGDCRSVKFHFKNQMDSKIKVRGVEIAGNEGTWTEDINNHEVLTNSHYTTDARTLNKLDSGKTPSQMTVNYDKWDSANGRWLTDKSKRFDDRGECSDGKTYNFVMQ